MNERRKKPDLIKQSGPKAGMLWVRVLFEYIFIIFVAKKIGAGGIANLLGPMLVCAIWQALFGTCASEIIKKRIRLFKGRDDYRGGVRLYHQIFGFCALLTLVFAVLLTVFSKQICEKLFNMHGASMTLAFLVFAVFFNVCQMCMQGFLEGMGVNTPSLISGSVNCIATLIIAIISAGKFAELASKVSAIIRDDEWFYAYMSGWAAFSVMCGALIGFIVMFVLEKGMKKRLADIFAGGAKRKQKGMSDAVFSLFSGMSQTAPGMVFPLISLLVLLVIVSVKNEGAFFGEYCELALAAFLLLRPLLLLTRQLSDVLSRQAATELKRRDMPRLRERIAIILKVFTYLSFPYLTFLIAMAPSVGKAFFDIESEAFSQALRIGCDQTYNL